MLRKRLADWADYLGAVFVADDTIMKLDDTRTKGFVDMATLERLRELRKYFETGEDPCFLDYIQIIGAEEEYIKVHQKAVSLLASAEEEVRNNTPGEGIDGTITFAERFAKVCLVEGMRLDFA